MTKRLCRSLGRGHTSLVTVEIERKFLLAQLPSAVSSDVGERLRQGYVAVDGDVNVRVRIVGRAATLTVKAGGGMARTEVEVAITTSQAEALWAHTVGRRIDKARYRIPLGVEGLTAEVDKYFDALAGWWSWKSSSRRLRQPRRSSPPTGLGPK